MAGPSTILSRIRLRADVSFAIYAHTTGEW
jgi:hypothetical protein